MKPQGLEKIRKSYYAILNDKLPKQLLQFLCWTRGLKQYYHYFVKKVQIVKTLIHIFTTFLILLLSQKI